MPHRIDIGGDQGRHPAGVEVGRQNSRFRDSLIADCPPEADIDLEGDGESPWLGLLLAIVVVGLLAATVLLACTPTQDAEIDCARRVCT